MDRRRLCVTIARASAGLLLSGCGAPLHGSDAGAQITTTTSSATAPAQASVGLQQSGHGYSGPLPTLDATCASATQVAISPGRPPDDKLPGYGFGPGPAYLSGQVWMGHAAWSASGEAGLILVAPSFTGPVHVIGARIGGGGKVHFGDTTVLVVAPSPPHSWWRYWSGRISFDTPGCYQLDQSGNGLSEHIVVQASAGTPLPG